MQSHVVAAPVAESDPALPPFDAFVQAQLAEVAIWLPSAIRATLERLEAAKSAARSLGERSSCALLIDQLTKNGALWSNSLVTAMREAIREDIHRADPHPPSATEPLDLSLIDEDYVDESIAVARLVQTASVEAGPSLRELTVLCSRMRGHDPVCLDDNPIRPSVVASALRRAVNEFGLPKEQRLVLLEEMGAGIGTMLDSVYASQRVAHSRLSPTPGPLELQLLDQPRQIATPGPAQRHAGDREVDAGQGVVPSVTRATSPPRRHDDAPELAEAGAAGLVAQLISELVRRSRLSQRALQLVSRLEKPATRIAEQNPDIWRQTDHALWQLIDKVLSTGSVHYGLELGGSEPADPRLETALHALESTIQPRESHCRAVQSALECAVADLKNRYAERIAAKAATMQAQLTRQEIESELRTHVAEQLRSFSVPTSLRGFLVDCWPAVMAHSASEHGLDGTTLRVQVAFLEDLAAAAARAPRSPISTCELTRFMAHARLGMTGAGFTPKRIGRELAALARTLRDAGGTRACNTHSVAEPGTVTPQGKVGHPDQAHAPQTVLGLHGSLATVLLDPFVDPARSPHAASALKAEAWIETLKPGAYCRIFLIDRWMNAELVWQSENSAMLVFASRHGACTHLLSRRSLCKLRCAGLAAAIERADFIAEVIRELAHGKT